MQCPIDNSSERRVFQIVYKLLKDHPKGEPMDVKDFMVRMNDLLSKVSDDKAWVYAQLALVPAQIGKAAGFVEAKRDISKAMDEVYSLEDSFMDSKTGLAVVESYFKVDEPVVEEPTIADVTQPQQDTPSPLAAMRRSKARPADFMTTTGQTAIDTPETPASRSDSARSMAPPGTCSR